MLRYSRSALFFLVLTFVLSVGAVSSRADGIPVYLVAGSVTITGNDVCGGPCTETIAFTFDVSFQRNLVAGNDVLPYVTNLTQTDSGNLGAFTSTSLVPPIFGTGTGFPAGSCLGNENYVALGGAVGTEVDLFVCSTAGVATLFTTASVPSILGSGGVLYGCATITCYNDLVLPCGSPGAGFGCASGGTPTIPAEAINQFAPAQYSVSMVPEPPTFILLASGMLLGLFGATYRKFLT